LGAALVAALMALLSRRLASRTRLLVAGLMVGYLGGALVSLLIWFSEAQGLQDYMLWTMGSFSALPPDRLPVLVGAVLVGCALALLQLRPLDALLLGDAHARSVGIDIRRARFGVLGTAALLSGAVTAFCGPIGFLGIAVPHLARRLLGSSRHAVLVPASLELGALLGLAALVLSEGSGRALPLNAITALLGAPVVLMVLLRGAR
jgi:iron complex transport system permease protein